MHKYWIMALLLALASAGTATPRLKGIYGSPLDSLLLERFSFERYEAETGIFDTRKLAEDAKALDSAGIDTQAFFQKAFAKYWQKNSLLYMDAAALKAHIALGAQLLAQDDLGLQIQGDELLQQISKHIELQMEAGAMEEDDEEVRAMVGMLAQEKYMVKPPTPSDSKKAWQNLKEGNFAYLKERFYSRCVVDCQTGDCSNVCVGSYSILALLGGALLFGIIALLKRRFANDL